MIAIDLNTAVLGAQEKLRQLCAETLDPARRRT